MSKLYVMMGAPGSGKSTWVRNHMNEQTDKWISRDEIRFSLISEKDEYFSKENQVFRTFINEIDKALNEGFNVFADATHLNRNSRSKLLNAISAKPDMIEVIWVNTPLHKALKRNEFRKGTRSFVPVSVLRRMFYSIEKPEFNEGFHTIYLVETNLPIKIIKEG